MRKAPGVRKGSGNAVLVMEGAGAPPGAGNLGIIGWLQEGIDEDPPPDQTSFLAWNCHFEALCSAVRIIRRHMSIE